MNFQLEWSINKTSFTTWRSNVRMSRLSMVDNSSKLPHTQKTAIIKLNMNWKCNFLLPSCHCWELNTAKDTDSPQPLLHQQLYFLPALHNLGENCQARVQAMSRSTNQISNSDSGGLDMELTLLQHTKYQIGCTNCPSYRYCLLQIACCK